MSSDENTTLFSVKWLKIELLITFDNRMILI